MNRKQSIKMVAFNPVTRRHEEVFPEDEVTVAEMTPMFRSGEGWVTVPGWEAEAVYQDWLKEVSGR